MTFRILLLFVVLGYSCRNDRTKEIIHTAETRTAAAPSLSYPQTLHKIDSIRKNLAGNFRSLDSSGKRDALSKAKSLLIYSISTDLFKYWKGTPWDFNGTTLQPNSGKIACGYFVTTLLKDAGVRLKRNRLSCAPSMTMIKELTSSKNIRNQSRLSFTEFCGWVNEQKNDLFIVGLDFHTGFLINDGKDSWFVHSNYINKEGVVKEIMSQSLALRSSKTRYVASLTNNEFLEKWLSH